MGDFVRFIEFSYKFFTPHNPSNPALIPFTSFFAFSLHTLCISTAYDEPTPLFAFILPSSSFISRQFSHSIHTYLPIGSYSFQHRSIPLKTCIQTLIQVTDYTIRV